MADMGKVLAEVQRRKQRARELRLPELTLHFYRDLARFYPTWRNNHPEIVPTAITDLLETGKNGVEFRFQRQHYRLTWDESTTVLPDGDLYYSSTLSLFLDATLVLEIYVQGSFDDCVGTTWRPADIKAFIEGPWLPAFLTLVSEADRLHAAYLDSTRKETRRREVEELALRFGIQGSGSNATELRNEVEPVAKSDKRSLPPVGAIRRFLGAFFAVKPKQ
ncbi:MAG: hypothetical protein ACE145_22000 [Terriglobia bacterium]